MNFGSDRSLSRLTVAAKPHQILVVEDSDEDYEILRRCVRQSASVVQLERCATGKQALEYLDRCLATDANGRSKSLPCLILLDLNLPGIDGRSVLRGIKQNPLLKHIPTIALTTSDNPKDVEDCYQLGINSYLLKAMEYQQFKETVQLLLHYWLDTVILPQSRTFQQPIESGKL